MAGRKKNPSMNVGAWLGGNRGYLQSGSNTDTSAKADAGGGQAEAVRGELGLGAYTAGIGATAAIGAGVAAARSGVAARAVNKVRGEVVGLHGSPVKGLKSVDPRISRSDVDIPTVSIMRTDVPAQLRAQNINVNQQYAGAQGSIYVVKAKKSATDLPKFPKPEKAPKRADGRPTLQLGPSAATKSRAPTRVVAEVPIQNYPTEAALRKEIAKQVRLAGSSMRTKTAQQATQDVIAGVKKKLRKSKPAPGIS